MTASGERDLRETQVALERWLTRMTDDDSAEVLEIELPEQGATGGCIQMAGRWEDEEGRRAQKLVLRLQPTSSLFLDPDVIRENRTMQLAGRHGVPVPELLWAEEDPEVIGVPFVAMRHVDGLVPQTVPSYHQAGWVTELPAEQRAQMHEQGLEALAAIHRVPWQGAGLFQTGAPSGLDRILDYIERFHAWAAAGRELGIIDDGLAYVLENTPSEDSVCLCWGDARPGNMIFSPRGSLRAIIDWDMSSLGPAELDVGWWLMYQEWATSAMGIELLDGVPGREDVVRTYEGLAGRELRDLDYYVVLATLRYAIITTRYTTIQVELGRLPADTTMHLASPVTQMLARQLDQPVMDLAPEFAAVAAASVNRGPAG
jgi:aminoglycoside phosphotransferase (APT) family kinase protein